MTLENKLILNSVIILLRRVVTILTKLIELPSKAELSRAYSRHDESYFDTDRNKPLDGVCEGCGFHLSYAVKIGHYCANPNCKEPIDLRKANELRFVPLEVKECPFHSEQAKWLLSFIARNKTTINNLLQ